MPFVPLQLAGPINTNVDESTLPQGQNAYLIDGYFDENGGLNRRPALANKTLLGTLSPVDGMYWWRELTSLLTVSNGKLVCSVSGGAFTNYFANDYLQYSNLVVFSKYPGYIFMSNGGNLVYWTGDPTNAITVSQAPTPTSSSAYLDGYVLAQKDNTDNFHWSTLGTPLVWDGLDFASASGAPDNIIRIAVGWREIVIFCTDSVEIWFNDGTTPFSRMQGAFIESGMAARASLVNVDNTWWYLDNNRNIVVLTGRTPQIVSSPIASTLHSLSTVSDCSAYTINGFGRKWVVFNFGTAGRTFVFDLNSKSWCEWGYFNTSNNGHENFFGRVYAYDAVQNKHFLGGRLGGTVFNMSDTTYIDDYNSAPVRTILRTGNFNHGTFSRKKSNRLRFRFRRGSASASNIFLEVKWRENDNATWNTERRLEIGTYGNNESIVEIQSPGYYRTRQYQISCSANTKFVLVGAEEDVEVMET